MKSGGLTSTADPKVKLFKKAPAPVTKEAHGAFPAFNLVPSIYWSRPRPVDHNATGPIEALYQSGSKGMNLPLKSFPEDKSRLLVSERMSMRKEKDRSLLESTVESRAQPGQLARPVSPSPYCEPLKKFNSNCRKSTTMLKGRASVFKLLLNVDAQSKLNKNNFIAIRNGRIGLMPAMPAKSSHSPLAPSTALAAISLARPLESIAPALKSKPEKHVVKTVKVIESSHLLDWRDESFGGNKGTKIPKACLLPILTEQNKKPASFRSKVFSSASSEVNSNSLVSSIRHLAVIQENLKDKETSFAQKMLQTRQELGGQSRLSSIDDFAEAPDQSHDHNAFKALSPFTCDEPGCVNNNGKAFARDQKECGIHQSKAQAFNQSHFAKKVDHRSNLLLSMSSITLSDESSRYIKEINDKNIRSLNYFLQNKHEPGIQTCQNETLDGKLHSANQMLKSSGGDFKKDCRRSSPSQANDD